MTHSKKRQRFHRLENSATGIFLRVGQRSKTTVDQTREEIFMQLVLPGLSSSSDTSSSSTSLPQDSSSTSSSPATERSDEPAPGNWRETNPITQNQNKKSNGNQDSDDRLRDLLEWLGEFTDNLEGTEVSAPAHISQDSNSERTTKVVSKSRKHGIYTHFPKDRNWEVCL